MDRAFKIILLGAESVGKSSLLHRLQTNSFKEKSLEVTVVDFHSKDLQVRDFNVTIHVWDTGGQERFKSISRSYFRHAEGVLLVYDVLDVTSFHKMSTWLNELRAQNDVAEVLIVGNKSEDPSRKAVSVSMVKNFCKTENLEYMEASAKSGENVDLIFHRLVEKILISKGSLLPPVESPEPSTSDVSNELEVIYRTISDSIPEIESSNEIIQLHCVPVVQPQKKKSCC